MATAAYAASPSSDEMNGARLTVQRGEHDRGEDDARDVLHDAPAEHGDLRRVVGRAPPAPGDVDDDDGRRQRDGEADDDGRDRLEAQCHDDGRRQPRGDEDLQRAAQAS